jgi:hypothetical protein
MTMMQDTTTKPLNQNKMKQTAVEWLVEQICGDHTSEWQEQIKQAKAMEKEQIEDAYDQMRCVGNYENGKQYYNETYAK